MMRDDLKKALTIHAELWKPLKVLAKDDLDMQRAYGTTGHKHPIGEINGNSRQI
jgi:hypothetical protein